jgi:MFS family permease
MGAIIGPALSGLVIATLGLQAVYYINAVSFISVLIALVAIGPVNQQVTVQSRREALKWSTIMEGIRFVFGNPLISSTMLLDFFATFFSSANTLMPFVVKDVLHAGPVEYGWLSAGQSIGAVAVGLVLSQRVQLRRQGPLLIGAVTVFGVATILFGVFRTFPLILLALILVGAGDAVSTILRNTIRQLQTPDYIRGRMVSINQIFFAGGPQLGEIEAGAVAQFFGPTLAIITGGVGCILAVAAVAFKWPQIVRYNGDEPVAAE